MQIMRRRLFVLAATAFLTVATLTVSPGRAEQPSKTFEQVADCIENARANSYWDYYDGVLDESDTTIYRSEGKTERDWLTQRRVVFGDMDGGFARTMLSALRARMIALPEAAVADLCDLALVEAQSARRAAGRTLRSYQADPAVAAQQAQLLRSAQFWKVPRGSVVWLGDIMFDRLTNNLRAMDSLIRRLKAHGAVFIMGNHEEYYRPQGCKRGSWGCFATGRANYSTEEFDDLLATAFVRAHYDSRNRLLHTHNGVKASGDVLHTAFGDLSDFRSRTPQEIVRWMGQQPIDYGRFTSFRPSDAAMEFTTILDGQNRIRQAHGHNACFTFEYQWVFPLNARVGFHCHRLAAAAVTFSPTASP